MPNNSVVVVIGGEDKSGAVLDQVEKHLVSLRARAAEADNAMSGMGGHMVPQMAAASATIRAMDGDFSHLIRAEERFLSTLPGLANLMQAAFPAIGIVATFYGLTRGAEALVDKVTELYRAWDVVTQAEQRAQTAFTGLMATYESETKRAQELIYENIGDTMGRVQELKTRAADVKLTVTADDQTAINQAKDTLDDLQRRANAPLVMNAGNWEHSKDAQAAQAGINNGEIALESARLKKENDQRELIHLTHELGDAEDEEGRKAEAAAERVARAQQKREEWVDRLRKKSAEDQERGKSEDEQRLQEMSRLNDEIAKGAVESEKKTSEAGEKALKEQIDAMREVQEERIKQAGDALALAERTTEYEVRMGRMSASERVAALRDAANQELAIKTDALQKIAGLDATSDSDSPEKVQKDLDQIKELQAKHDAEMEQLAEQAAERRKAIMDQFVSDILDPLMNRPKSIEDAFKKMGESIEKTLQKIAEHRIESLLSGALDGDGGKGAAGGSASAKGPSGGFGGIVGGLLGKLSGMGSEFGGAKASNGGLSTGAGTLPDSTASGLLQGRGTGAGGGVVVNLITQGTPQTVDSSGSQGNGQLEQMIVSIVLKDADTLGPMSQGIGGAIQMLGLG